MSAFSEHFVQTQSNPGVARLPRAIYSLVPSFYRLGLGTRLRNLLNRSQSHCDGMLLSCPDAHSPKAPSGLHRRDMDDKHMVQYTMRTMIGISNCTLGGIHDVMCTVYWARSGAWLVCSSIQAVQRQEWLPAVRC